MSKPEMIKYTAKFFAKADLATHPDGRIAARVNPESKYPWVLSTRDDDYDWEGDDYLARDGWTPVDLAGLTARAEKAEEVSESWRALCQAATDQRDARDLAALWKDEGMSDYTPEQRQAVTEALDGLADHLDRMADHADASDHWAWEYRYADEVREYLAEWRKKYTQG